VENDPPHRLDTEVAIQSMRKNKAPNIPITLYKKGQLLINMLHTLQDVDRRESAYGLDNKYHSNKI